MLMSIIPVPSAAGPPIAMKLITSKAIRRNWAIFSRIGCIPLTMTILHLVFARSRLRVDNGHQKIIFDDAKR